MKTKEQKPSAPTPGPWRQFKPWTLTTGRIVEADYGIRVADVMERHAHLTPQQCEANARLIAAAPELLTALKHALEILSDFTDGDAVDVAIVARTTIAKAEGRELSSEGN